jgi:hypothetical protein
MDLVNAIESEFPVEQWRLADIRVWPMIRMVIFVQLFYRSRGATGEASPSKVREKWLIAKKVTKCYLTDWRHNVHWCRRADALILTYDGHRQRLGSVWYDRFCDRFVDELDKLGWRSLVYELTATPDLRDCRVPRARSTVYVQPIIEAALGAARMVEVLRKTETPEWYLQLAGWCAARGIEPVLPSFMQIATAARAVSLLARWLERRLTTLGTKVLFAVQYYHVLGYAANVACRRLGIPSVDIQHGVQGEYHSAYGRWTRVPLDGYEVLPSTFWCWSDVEAAAIDAWAKRTSHHQTFVGGDLWRSGWRQVIDERAPIAAEQLAALKPEGSQLVVFCSSYPNDLSDWLLAAMRQTPPNVRWAVRLHPNHYQLIDQTLERLREHGLPNVDVRRVTDLPLPVVLRLADLNVTSVSTVVIEAAQLQVPSIITDPTGLDIYRDLVEAGSAIGAFTTEALVSAVERYKKARLAEPAWQGDVSDGAVPRFVDNLGQRAAGV